VCLPYTAKGIELQPQFIAGNILIRFLLFMDAIELPVDVEFSIHAAAHAIQNLDRNDLEEAFVEILHQKALDRQMFFGILKDHGIDADIQFNISTMGQIS
tara:strand:- start:1156 stop:1455 length:300 start_codon:yes stop_codon:yes gene_type:complete